MYIFISPTRLCSIVTYVGHQFLLSIVFGGGSLACIIIINLPSANAYFLFYSGFSFDGEIDDDGYEADDEDGW